MTIAARRSDLHRMTVDQFLEWDDGTDTRYELIDGLPVAMAPPTAAHARIAAAVATGIQSRLKPPCYVLVEAGIAIPDRDDSFHQADVAVVCQPLSPGVRHAPPPTVIVEILSPSTASHDRGVKAAAYRLLPSVQEIALVASTEPRIELWRRHPAGWLVEDLTGAETVLAFRSVDIAIEIAAIYEGVPFGAERASG